MAHNWLKRALRPRPTPCNWSIRKRVTPPLAEIAALIALYVEPRPRCNESNLSPPAPAGDTTVPDPSRVGEVSAAGGSTSSRRSPKKNAGSFRGGRQTTPVGVTDSLPSSSSQKSLNNHFSWRWSVLYSFLESDIFCFNDTFSGLSRLILNKKIFF